MPNGLVKELQEVEPLSLPARDVRAGKPLLGGLLRFDFARGGRADNHPRRARPAGLFLAIYTALIVKTAIRHPDQIGQMWDQALDYLPLGGLVMLLLFARSGLYRERAQRPGLPRVIASLFQTTVAVLLYALFEGESFQSYYIFYGSLFFALIYVSGVPLGVRAGHRRDPARRRLPPPRGAGRLRREHPGGLARAARQPRDRAVRLRGPHAARARGRPARLPLARAARAPLRHDRRGPDRGRRLPRGGGRRARGPLPPAGRARARGALHDGDPDGAGRVRARPGAAAVRAEAAGVRGRRLRAQADVRPRRRDAARGRALAGDDPRGAGRSSSPRAGRSSTARSGRGSAGSASPA